MVLNDRGLRLLAKVLLGTGEFDSAPMIASPGIPAEQVKILREPMQRVNDADLIAEEKKRGLECELIYGERESLAKEGKC